MVRKVMMVLRTPITLERFWDNNWEVGEGGEGVSMLTFGNMIRDLLLDQLCATSDISVEEKGVRNLLLMEKLRSHVLVSKT